MKRRRNKSISFRLLDAYEERLLMWAESDERGDFSKYIKRLIGRDMEGQSRPPAATVSITAPIREESLGDFEGFT